LAGQRRLKEELSIVVPLKRVGSFQYIAAFENGLTEHELDHVLVGEYDTRYPIVLNPAEVDNVCWMPVKELMTELSLHSAQYTPWFKPALTLVLEDLCINY
jgi:isopentenyl-diphosphate delta-isomerase